MSAEPVLRKRESEEEDGDRADVYLKPKSRRFFLNAAGSGFLL